MPPHLGAGAGQCIEDAYLLSELLTHPETNHGNLEVSVMTHYESGLMDISRRISCEYTTRFDVQGLSPSGMQVGVKATTTISVASTVQRSKDSARTLKVSGTLSGIILPTKIRVRQCRVSRSLACSASSFHGRLGILRA